MRPRRKEASAGAHGLHPETQMMGYGYRPEWSEGALKCPIFQTSTFVFKNAEEGKAFFEIAYGLRKKGPTEVLGLIYSRLNNPDLEILEDRLALWDKAEACCVFDSGMAAISTVFLQFLRPGDVLIHSEPIYGGTDYFIHHVLPTFGIEAVGFPAGASREVAEARLSRCATAGRPALIFVETPANPTNALVDIRMCADLAKSLSTPERQVLLAVDNTFLGPLWQHPLRQGADLVLYSATKYIGGHSDLIAGVCVGSSELMQQVRTLRTFLGNMADPWTGWLLLRSLETLKLRMTCQMTNARRVAEFLKDHPQVERTYYLGHLAPEEPQFEVFHRQCLSPGAMISFDVAGGQEGAYRFLNALKVVKLAVSLGGTESLAEHPATMTHADVMPEEQRRMGITPQMVRLSVGVEHPDDIINDLQRALAAV